MKYVTFGVRVFNEVDTHKFISFEITGGTVLHRYSPFTFVLNYFAQLKKSSFCVGVCESV